MKEIFKGCPARFRRGGIYVFILVLTVFAAGTAGLGFTKEKAQKREIREINKENVRLRNVGCDTQELNPLRKNEHPDINCAVEEHFKGLMEGETFVESYDDINVYTKVGRYRDTYIAFAEYRMKIKDMYTEVPGLATLYISKDEESGKYRIDAKEPEGLEEEYVQAITGHEDVRELLRRTEDEFNSAVHSDALLREALADLKNAYAAYTG